MRITRAHSIQPQIHQLFFGIDYEQLSRQYQAAMQPAMMVQVCKQAIAVGRDTETIYEQLAYAYYQLNRVADTNVIIAAGLLKYPNSQDIIFHKALQALNRGDWQAGWADWEARVNHRLHTAQIPTLLPTVTEWNGIEQPGEILVIGEHGLGDQLLFVRYLKNLQELGGTVLFVAREPLVRLLRENQEQLGIYKVLAPVDTVPATTTHWIGLESLPYRLGITQPTQLDSYLNHAPGQHDGRRIGICWKASQFPEAYRSIDWDTFSSVLNDEDSYVSLQLGVTCPDKRVDNRPITLAKDLSDTSHIMDTLDMVVTVDTSVAHLAAAKGIETLVLRPIPFEWRFGSTGTQSPFYQHVTVYRQVLQGDWSLPIAQVVKRLL